jgi:hypothetical protein
MDVHAIWLQLAHEQLVERPKGVPLDEDEWQAWNGVAAALFEQLGPYDFWQLLSGLAANGLLPYPKAPIRMALDGMPSDEGHRAVLALKRSLLDFLGGKIRDDAHLDLVHEFKRLTTRVNNARETRLGRKDGSDAEHQRVRRALLDHRAAGGNIHDDYTAEEWADRLNASVSMVNRVRQDLRKNDS